MLPNYEVPHMAERASENLTQAGATNFEIRSIDTLTLPYGDRSFDVILSNGVLNLSPDKEVSLRELHRVLKPGGRFQFADVVLEQELPSTLVNSAESWSQ